MIDESQRTLCLKAEQRKGDIHSFFFNKKHFISDL